MRREDPKSGVRSEDESPNYLRIHVSKKAVLKYLVPKLTRALTKDFRVLQYDICHDETVCKHIFEEFVRTFQGDLHSSAEVTNVIDVHDVFEETLLLAAANVSNLASVKTLLDMGADVNVRNRTGQTALHLACEADRIDVHLIKLLLAQGISVNMVDRKGRTALHVACEANRLDVSVLGVLLKTNCDVNITDSSGDTALHKACKGSGGDICILKLQIPPNADTPVPDNESRRSIVRVCRAGLDARDLVHLSTQSVDINVPYSNEITVLYLLCVGNSVDSDIIRYLSDAGIRMGVENRRESESLYVDNTENRATCPFEVMVTKGADVKIADRTGTTALHLECQNISMDVCVIEALIKHPTDVNIVNKDGKTALHFACEGERADVRLVKLLVMHGSGVNIADTKGNTPLHLACLKVCINTRVCEILVTHGADVNMIGENRQTPLQSACTTSDVDIGLIDLLIQHNANVNIPDDNGRTPLYRACTTSDVNIGLIDLLIQHKANLNIPDDNGETPLHTACGRSDVDFRVIDLLLTYGADVNVVNPLNGMTALLFLVNGKYEVDFRVVELLLTHGADVNTVDGDGNSALLHRLFMITHKDEGVIELLITHGANVNITNDDGLSALFLSGRNRKDFGVLELLLTHGADVNSTDQNGRTMLHTILNSNNIDVRCVELLLTKGADVNIADVNRMTAFQSMCIIGSLDVRVIDLLVKHGVDVNTIKEDGGTALHSACSGDNKHVRLVTSLINHGADINVTNEDGMTPLHLACSRVDEIIVYDLVDNTLQKELDIRNENDFQVIELLVTNGADVNATDEYGWTALHRQCRARSAEVRVIDLLRKHGADVNITDEVGMTALHRACKAGSGFDDISFEFNDGEKDQSTDDKEDKIPVMEYLIRRYMAVNTADKDAKCKVHGDFIRMLVKLGADVNKVDADGNTALHILCKGKMNENSEISSLVESGADLYRHNRKGWIAYCLQSDRLVPNNVLAQCTNLMMAVQNGDVSAAHELLIQGVPINTTDRFGRTALHYLCLCDYIDTSILSLMACKQYVNMPDRFGNTALHCLCRRRDKKEIVNMPRLLKILLEAEADVNVRDEFGFSSLYYLRGVMSSKMLDLLMIHCNQLNENDGDGLTLMHYMCVKGQWECLKKIISEADDMNKPSSKTLYVEKTNTVFPNGSTALQLACMSANITENNVQMMIHKGADVNISNKHGRIPLHVLSTALPDISWNGKWVLRRSRDQEKLHICLLLLRGGSDIHKQDKDGFTALGNVKVLLDSVNSAMEGIQTICDEVSALIQNNSVVHDLLKESDIAETDIFGRTALHYLCLSEHPHQADFQLVPCNTDVNKADKWGSTALHNLCRRYDIQRLPNLIQLLQILLESGADINTKDEYGYSSLYYLREIMNVELLGILMSHCTQLNEDNGDGLTLLHYLCATGSRECLEMLLDYVDDLDKEVSQNVTSTSGNCVFVQGLTVLPIACMTKGVDKGLIEMILHKGADVNTADVLGKTPLHYICERSLVFRWNRAWSKKALTWLSTNNVTVYCFLLDRVAEAQKKDNRHRPPNASILQNRCQFQDEEEALTLSENDAKEYDFLLDEEELTYLTMLLKERAEERISEPKFIWGDVDTF
ncbi:serine/threonine-protein phosphatase 6 regulatory ankyrin repeat subunit A-like isoform X2 [Haliotis rufescens]|uniref:serine/threonine-protein phosphatase 6 regulatory ankyrin repeat subunit A-like isoform X2 n=1 Tax=Haliotis rufescens TaxID=6454 RepID=UPI00201F77E8|nr:serine/threonine-protein phosphatase 6 regulatory ankyrin repeat subunit A-like isoform X2 [Haliotis rufescens]